MIPLKPKHTFKEKMLQFNQHWLDESWCTYITGITIIANNHWIDFSENDIKKLLEWRPKSVLWNGSNYARALYFLTQQVNAMFWTKIRLEKIDSSKCYYQMKAGRMVAIAWKINYAYVEDIKDWTRDKDFVTKYNDMSHARAMHILNSTVVITENFDWILPKNTFPIRDYDLMIKKWLIRREAFLLV